MISTKSIINYILRNEYNFAISTKLYKYDKNKIFKQGLFVGFKKRNGINIFTTAVKIFTVIDIIEKDDDTIFNFKVYKIDTYLYHKLCNNILKYSIEDYTLIDEKFFSANEISNKIN